MLVAAPATKTLSMTAEAHGSAAGDSALVARAAAGDARAFRAIFERYAPAVRRFLIDLLRDAPAADEATQETFVRAHRALGTIRDPEHVGAWVFGIARHVHLEKRRAQRRTRAVADLGEGRDDDGPGDGVLIDRAPSPEAAVLGKEADRVLADALSVLSDDRREALLLRLDHGLGYPAIADHMGWSIPKVKNEIHRGRLQLRAELARYMGDKE
jgi:RNA polymerase sigma-70 factor (ECF subfamily)